MPETPYIAIGNEELEKCSPIKAGDLVPCPKCGKPVKVKNSEPPVLQCITHCNKSFIVGINNKLITKAKKSSGKLCL